MSSSAKILNCGTNHTKHAHTRPNTNRLTADEKGLPFSCFLQKSFNQMLVQKVRIHTYYHEYYHTQSNIKNITDFKNKDNSIKS